MRRRGTRATTWSLLGGILISGAALGGCATDVQTAAAAAAGSLLGLQLGAQALTGSKLQVQIDMYAATEEEQRAAMRLDHPFVITRLLDVRRPPDDGDLLRNATPASIISLSVRLQPVMDGLTKAAETLLASGRQLKSIDTTGQFKPVTDTFDAQAGAATAALEAWKTFMKDLKENVDRINQPDVLDTLASDLLTLRVRLYRAARLDGVTPGYLDFLRVALRAALLQDASPTTLVNVMTQINTALQGIKDHPTAPGAERIAAILDALRGPLAAVGKNHAQTDATLKAFGLSIDSATLLTLPSKQAIAAALAPPEAAPLVARPTPAKTPPPASPGSPDAPAACTGAAAVVVVQLCSTTGYETISLALNKATADVSLGPISNEVQQVLQAAARGLGTITDPRNEEHWHLKAAFAKSDGGPGNHNTIIYFENMGLPVVKSSTFDPTKFVVAQGALYRQVFSAAVATFGAPLQSTAGPAGAPDLQSSNVIATRARILNAQKAAATAREKIIDALKTTIDQQQKIKDGNWAANKADLLKAAQKALQDSAGQLEGVGGTN